MDEVGPLFSSLLQDIAAGRFDEALSAVSVLANAALRLEHCGEDTHGACAELASEAQVRLRRAAVAALGSAVDASTRRVREGNLADADRDLNQCIRLCSVCAGLDLIKGKDESSAARDQIARLMLVHLTVKATVKLHAIEKAANEAAKAKRPPSDETFLQGMEDLLGYYMTIANLINTTDALLAGGEAFTSLLIEKLSQATVSQALPIIKRARTDYRVDALLKRASELGGLTLPRALSGNSVINGSKEGGNSSSSTADALEPLTESESDSLDAALHCISSLSRTCHLFAQAAGEPSARPLMDELLGLLAAMVPLDELWLTHNISKAVSHAVSLDLSQPGGPRVNSIAEDTLHVCSTSFARAAYSLSRMVCEATTNHLAGFLSDGFCAIASELVEHARSGKTGGEGTSASLAAQQLAKASASSKEDVLDITTALDRTLLGGNALGTRPILCEAVNTLQEAATGLQALKAEISSVFTDVFPSRVDSLMAISLLSEAETKLNRWLEDAIGNLAKDLFPAERAKAVLKTHFPPAHYQMGIAAFETEDVWVMKIAPVVLHAEAKSTLHRLSVAVAEAVGIQLGQLISTLVETWTWSAKFTALGAIKFDKAVRSLIEAVVQVLGASARSCFKRLRHICFLLNLQSSKDAKDFPGESLSEPEVKRVLLLRVEPDF